MRRFLAVLLSSVVFATSLPFAINANEMEGENLSPSECYSEPVVSSPYTENKYLLDKDRAALMEALETGYIQVPDNPNQPMRPLTESDLQDPKANDNESAIIDNTPYKGNEYFCFLEFKASTGDTSKKRHFTSMKKLRGSRDTNDTVYCLQMNKRNPPSGTKLEMIKKESEELLYLIRLGFPRGHTDRVPKDISDCFYKSSDGADYAFWNYYITQATIWAKIGDTTMSNILAGTVINGAPSDLPKRCDKFNVRAPKYGPDWVTPKIWINHERVEATTDEKDPSQLCTPNYELDVDGMDSPEHCLKLMERNVYTDLGSELPPAMEMTIDDAPPGLRVLVYDKREQKNRVYEIDNGDKPLLWAQDQFRFIVPNPTESGEFTYTISGVYWTWRAYRYQADGDYQDMLKEDVVKFGEKLTTSGEIFWKVEETPPPVEEPQVYIKKVDKRTGQQMAGAEIGIYKESNDSEVHKFTSSDRVEDITDKVTVGEQYYAKELSPPADYELDPTEHPFTPQNGQTVTVTIENSKPNAPNLYPINVKKVDAETGEALPGAKFQLVGTDVDRIEVSGEDGIAPFTRLPEGEYTITEIEAPEGYTLPTEASQTVTLPGQQGETVEIVFKDNKKLPNSFELKALKVDATNDKALAGAEFTLTHPDGKVDKGVSNAEGKVVFSNLTQTGKYILEETKAPEGYQLAENPKQEIQVDDAKNPPTAEFIFKNQPITGSVELVKTDAKTGKELEGVKFGLYVEETDTEVGTFITDANGVIKVENLLPGKYYFKELEAPEGYILDQSKVTFEVTSEGGLVKVSKTNTPEENEGSVEITKTDVSTGEVIAGAKIKIYGSDKETVLAEGVTGDDGKFTFGPLRPGTYYFQESGAPEGYVLDDTLHPFEIKEDGGVTKCTLTNKPIEGTLEISKVDISTGKLLPGAKFVIYDEGKNMVVKGVTDENGIATFRLPYGKYYYQEYGAPEGYQLDDTLFPFEIKENDEIVKCRMTNTPIPKTPLPKTGAAVVASGSGIATVVSVISLFLGRRRF